MTKPCGKDNFEVQLLEGQLNIFARAKPKHKLRHNNTGGERAKRRAKAEVGGVQEQERGGGAWQML